jgi:hypothetical protein
MSDTTLPPFFLMDCTDKGDKFSNDFYLYNDQVFQFLNSRLTGYGSALPSFTTAQVTAFPDTVKVGTIWYNNTLKKLQFKADNPNVIETITSV